MKIKNIVIPFLLIAVLIGCETKKEGETVNKKILAEGTRKGTVVETMNAASYTYALVEEDGAQLWIAGPTTEVQAGETIFFSEAVEMKNFHSETLDKTFESIYFVNTLSKNPIVNEATNPHGMGEKKGNTRILSAKSSDLEITRAEGTITIADLFRDKTTLAGKNVKVTGKVTKYNSGILDRNWIHIQDGTDFEGKYDLLVTSQETTKVGDVITVEGQVALDVDFGAGYSYEVLIEQGKISK